VLPPASRRSLDEQLERIHWHILRSDSLRASVASRAGTLLSTNALVIAGIALALGFKSHKPETVVTILTIAALGCVAVSVMNASMAAVTVRRWPRQFPKHKKHVEHIGPPYSFAEINSSASTFEDFKQGMTNQSADQLLEDALAELWRCGMLHGYRYAKLRIALRWLLTALCLFLAAVTASVFVP
jgi:hypothetical protein